MSRLNALLKPKGSFGDYHWQIDTWSQLQEGATKIREAVFTQEQLQPADANVDEHDVSAVHILMSDADGNPVATARMVKAGQGISHLGRMAVLFEHRGEGLGRMMLLELMIFAKRRRDTKATLHTPLPVVGFYKKLGFQVEGEPFIIGNVPQVKMVAEL